MPLKPIEKAFKEGQWAGHRAWIVGGGQSLLGFPFYLLKNEKVIAVNRAHECGVADVVVTGDSRWLGRYSLTERVPIGIPVVYARRSRHANPNWEPKSEAYLVECCYEPKLWGTSFEEGVSQGCSGIRAANFAAMLGANPIYLLGFDLEKFNVEQRWWHEGYEDRQKDYHDSFLAFWNRVIDSGQINVDIFNCSPSSRLERLPYQDATRLLF